MKRWLLPLLCVAACSAQSANLGTLRLQFRQVTGERDSSVSLFRDADVNLFFNLAQNKVAKLGGYLDKVYDILYSSDSSSYGLPGTFKYVEPTNGVMIKNTGASWQPVYENPGFKKDTTVFSFMIGRHNTDVARIYIKGGPALDGDTIRVFFKGGPTALTTDASNCEIPDDLEWAVIDEAVALSERARRSFDVLQLLWQITREDMGFEKQVRSK